MKKKRYSIYNFVWKKQKEIELVGSQTHNLLNPIRNHIINRNYSILNNKFYSTTNLDNQEQPIVSLRDIVEYKMGIVQIKPYQGLLKGKENSKFDFGKAKLYPNPSEYVNFKDICD
jgi:hypothetical protein